MPQNLLLQFMQRPLSKCAAIKNCGAFLAAIQKPCVNEDLQVMAERALAEIKIVQSSETLKES